ncbi:SRPBCC domain-containing protein [[Kitasatospora] papulosa]|uniref:SRPBCC domain-containing protein n=1 Tax=[Kitasatospora] papulosa TaxID=1464011 RepID=UPI0036A9FB66
MSRTDRAARMAAATPATVYEALLDRESLEAWLPPEGMLGRVEHWDPRTGGGFRMVLTCLDPTGGPGRTTGATDHRLRRAGALGAGGPASGVRGRRPGVRGHDDDDLAPRRQ